MNVIADVCIIPLGVGLSVSKYVVACEQVFADAGLTPKLHGYGTNVEGDWDTVMELVRSQHGQGARAAVLPSATMQYFG